MFSVLLKNYPYRKIINKCNNNFSYNSNYIYL